MSATRLAPPPAAVPPGSRVYAIGDVHGRHDLLVRLLGTIIDDAGRGSGGPPPGRIVLVSVGDLIDRGPDSRAVIELMSARPLAGARTVCLRGNHEDTMLRFLTDFSVAAQWFRNGGLETIRSYLGTLPDDGAGDHPALQRRLYRALPPTHLDFLEKMPVRHVEGDYLFVHAGVRPGVALDHQDPTDLMWIRAPFLHSSEAFAKMVVHGHSVVDEPEIRPNRIAIDTGAYRSDRLTCLVLEGTERRFMTT